MTPRVFPSRHHYQQHYSFDHNRQNSTHPPTTQCTTPVYCSSRRQAVPPQVERPQTPHPTKSCQSQHTFWGRKWSQRSSLFNHSPPHKSPYGLQDAGIPLLPACILCTPLCSHCIHPVLSTRASETPKRVQKLIFSSSQPHPSATRPRALDFPHNRTSYSQGNLLSW